MTNHHGFISSLAQFAIVQRRPARVLPALRDAPRDLIDSKLSMADVPRKSGRLVAVVRIFLTQRLTMAWQNLPYSNPVSIRVTAPGWRHRAYMRRHGQYSHAAALGGLATGAIIDGAIVNSQARAASRPRLWRSKCVSQFGFS